jgi:hypothetical protein
LPGEILSGYAGKVNGELGAACACGGSLVRAAGPLYVTRCAGGTNPQRLQKLLPEDLDSKELGLPADAQIIVGPPGGFALAARRTANRASGGAS